MFKNSWLFTSVTYQWSIPWALNHSTDADFWTLRCNNLDGPFPFLAQRTQRPRFLKTNWNVDSSEHLILSGCCPYCIDLHLYMQQQTVFTNNGFPKCSWACVLTTFRQSRWLLMQRYLKTGHGHSVLCRNFSEFWLFAHSVIHKVVPPSLVNGWVVQGSPFQTQSW